MLGTGSRVVASEKIQAQGNMISTENSLDMAIEGQGQFQILQQDGNFAYTGMAVLCYPKRGNWLLRVDFYYSLR